MKTHLPIVLALVFMAAAGMADALCFVSAARVWQRGTIVWPEVGKAFFWVQVGIIAYLVAATYLTISGVKAAELQTMIWFTMTTVGVAVLSRQFLGWSRTDQLVAFVVLAGVVWLFLRTAGGT